MDNVIAYLLGVCVILYPIYLFCRSGYRDMKSTKQSYEIKKWEKENLSRLGFYENGKYKLENTIFYASGVHSFIIYDNDRKLYFFDSFKLSLGEIKLESIMDIKVDITVNTKNVKRLVALTSTYDTNSTSYGHLTIITEGRNYVVNYLSDVNELNRFKLILEKHINELNSTNN